MNASIRHSLTNAVVKSAFTVMEKQASATPEQSEVISHAWPTEGTALEKLAKVLGTGVMIEEADAG